MYTLNQIETLVAQSNEPLSDETLQLSTDYYTRITYLGIPQSLFLRTESGRLTRKQIANLKKIGIVDIDKKQYYRYGLVNAATKGEPLDPAAIHADTLMKINRYLQKIQPNGWIQEVEETIRFLKYLGKMALSQAVVQNSAATKCVESLRNENFLVLANLFLDEAHLNNILNETKFRTNSLPNYGRLVYSIILKETQNDNALQRG